MIELPLDSAPGTRVVNIQDISSFEPSAGTGTLIVMRDGPTFRTPAEYAQVRAAVLTVRSQFESLVP